jgi:hypothetical protein
MLSKKMATMGFGLYPCLEKFFLLPPEKDLELDSESLEVIY